MLARQLRSLREHTDSSNTQPQVYDVDNERFVRQRLRGWDIPLPPVSENITAAMKNEITKHRTVRTTACRVVEMDIREVLANHPLPAVALHMLYKKLHRFIMAVRGRNPELIPPEIDITELLNLDIQETDLVSQGSLLQELGKLGVIVPSEVHSFVATGAFGNTDEILSPPEHLREICKPVGKERAAQEDCGLQGPFTKNLWRTNWRVRDCCTPPISEYEVKAIFGADATLTSHADKRLPYECGANKYTLVEQDPFVMGCTDNGLFTTAGPSGTAYRYLNLWLVLGGPREKLPELRLALTALILGGLHHSLAEVMAVSAPILGQEMPSNLEEMLNQLVPYTLELEWGDTKPSMTPEAFRDMIAHRLKARLA
ncbi:MAG: hypothetical protein Q9209_004724 [Squamulea sp. 1 TL-2023]